MEGSDLPCFENFDINSFRERFKESSTDVEVNDNKRGFRVITFTKDR